MVAEVSQGYDIHGGTAVHGKVLLASQIYRAGHLQVPHGKLPRITISIC